MDIKRIAICADSEDIEQAVSNRFARCNFYALYDFDSKTFSFTNNEAKKEMSGAGSKAAQVISELNAEVVLVPEVGPKAYTALNAFDIDVYSYQKGSSVKETVYQFYENKLEKVTGPTTKGKH